MTLLGDGRVDDFTQVGISWEVGVPGGWGTCGVNLGVELARKKALSLRYS